jgi:hypothetical protein
MGLEVGVVDLDQPFGVCDVICIVGDRSEKVVCLLRFLPPKKLLKIITRLLDRVKDLSGWSTWADPILVQRQACNELVTLFTDRLVH